MSFAGLFYLSLYLAAKLHVLDAKGHRITWGQYMRVGLVLTPPVLLATLVALWVWLPLVSSP